MTVGVLKRLKIKYIKGEMEEVSRNKIRNELNLYWQHLEVGWKSNKVKELKALYGMDDVIYLVSLKFFLSQ